MVFVVLLVGVVHCLLLLVIAGELNDIRHALSKVQPETGLQPEPPTTSVGTVNSVGPLSRSPQPETGEQP